ncbi:MAG: hypothetical protein WKF43_16565 [Acidimicrobiales bacterium]
MTYNQWAIDANEVKVADAQEENYWWDNGDEVQVGVVGFRTVLGTRDSTRAWLVGDLQTHCSGADDGRVCSINDSPGRASFGYVRRIGLDDIEAGYKPSVIGTIQVAIEEDETPDSSMESILRELATITDQELTTASEGLSDSDLANLTRVTERFKAAAKRIKDRAQPRWYEKAAIFFESWGNPDDVITGHREAVEALRPRRFGPGRCPRRRRLRRSPAHPRPLPPPRRRRSRLLRQVTDGCVLDQQLR